MAGYVVQVQTIEGTWVPKDAKHQLLSLAAASVESFDARLNGYTSRIVEWPAGAVVAESPGRAV